MKLESGKNYIRKDGVVVTIVYDKYDKYPKSNLGTLYRDDGTPFFETNKELLTLVSETDRPADIDNGLECVVYYTDGERVRLVKVIEPSTATLMIWGRLAEDPEVEIAVPLTNVKFYTRKIVPR